MNKAIPLLLLSLLACGPAPQDTAPDAAPTIDAAAPRPDAQAVDAQNIDAPPQGCTVMGNLPNSRTIDAVQGEPVPPDLINEIQDNIIGAKRRAFKRRYYPRFVVQGGWDTGSLVTAGGFIFPGFTSTGITPGHVEIPLEVGEHLIGMTFQACGNGVTDLQVDLQIFGDYASGSLSLGNVTDNNRAAAWGTVNVAVDTTRPALVDGGLAKMVLTASAAGYTIAQITATIERL